jgi:hypothetical protein
MKRKSSLRLFKKFWTVWKIYTVPLEDKDSADMADDRLIDLTDPLLKQSVLLAQPQDRKRLPDKEDFGPYRGREIGAQTQYPDNVDLKGRSCRSQGRRVYDLDRNLLDKLKLFSVQTPLRRIKSSPYRPTWVGNWINKALMRSRPM